MKKRIIPTCLLVSSLTLMSCGSTNASTTITSSSPSAESTTAVSTDTAGAESTSYVEAAFMQYVEFTLPDSLTGYEANSNDELSVAFKFADTASTDSGIKHGEGVEEICYDYATVTKYQGATPQFNDSNLTGIDYPWSNCTPVDDAESLTNNSTPGIIQSIDFDLFTAAELEQQQISEDLQTSSYWCLSFVKDESSSTTYYFLFSKDYFSKDDVTSFAKTVSFEEGAF